MKRNLRFYFALFFAKGTALVLKLIGRKGTSMPGSWAIILCPDFLGRMQKPRRIIGITGTNGKTSTANLITDVLEKNGIPCFSNRMGSNVNTGIVSALLQNSDFLGRPKVDTAVLEIDERSAPKIFPYLQPDLLVCTNLCRDALDRNAHIDFLVELLDRNIGDKVKLVVNGDDLIVTHLKPGNVRVSFGIAERPGEREDKPNLVRDIITCPECGTALAYDFLRYNHIGRAHCPKCGYGSPEHIDFEATQADVEKMRFTVQTPEGAEEYKLPGENITDLYNVLAAVTALRTFGLSYKAVQSGIEAAQMVKSRFNVISAGGKEVVMHLAKGQSPIASSRVFDFIHEQGVNSAVVLLNYDQHDHEHGSENVAWLYEADYEFLNDPCVRQIVAGGSRCYDYAVRAAIAGISPQRIACAVKPEDVVDLVDLDGIDRVYILYAVFTQPTAEGVCARLVERLEGGMKA